MAMRKTLYDIVRPMCIPLHAFGFNFGGEKPEGCWRRIYNWAVTCALVYGTWKITSMGSILESMTYNVYHSALINFDLLLLSSCVMRFFCVNEGEMKMMITKLKQHRVGKESDRSLNKHLLPFKIYSKLFVVAFTLFTLNCCFKSFLALLFTETPVSSILSTFFIHEGAFLFLQVPTILCILPCIVAGYCRAEMDEAMEEMKRIKSPLRRAKASAKLIEKYQQLYELASATDRALSSAVSFIKWPFLITIVTSAMSFDQPITNIRFLFYEYYLCSYFDSMEPIPVVFLYFPLLQYLYSAPAANQMFNRMNRAMAEFQSMDEEWLSREPISPPHLLRMKMNRIERLSLMATEDPPFTLFGDVVDDDVLYLIILEIIDMWNTLSVHACGDDMTLNRIFGNFMSKILNGE